MLGISSRRSTEDPDGIDFDPQARSAFMNYLLSEYFLKADLSSPFSLDEKNIRKITQWR